MKLTYKAKVAIISVLILVFFLILNLTPVAKEIKNFFYLISSPIQKSLWAAGGRISDFFETISEIKNLKKENEELKLKIQELISENVSLKELKKENELLRETLGVGLEKKFKLTLAQVTGKDVSQDFISIDKGAKDGILEGLPVITPQKVLIGKVDLVYRNFAKVLLISHPKSSFDGKVQEREALGLVRGKGNLKIFFELIPKEKEIKEGDLVVTGSLGGVFPKDLAVGQISQVKKSDLEPFQMAEIRPSFNMGDLEKLFIITEW